MNTAYIAGMVCGVLAVALVCYVVASIGKKAGKVQDEYDERQRAIRDRGFRFAYLTLIGYLAVFFFVDSLGVVWCETGGGIFLGVIVSLLVHIVYSIYNDAYFKVSDSPRRFVILFAGVGIGNILIGIGRRIHGDIEGLLSYGDMNLIVGVFIMVAVVNILVKMQLDKRRAED